MLSSYSIHSCGYFSFRFSVKLRLLFRETTQHQRKKLSISITFCMMNGNLEFSPLISHENQSLLPKKILEYYSSAFLDYFPYDLCKNQLFDLKQL